MFNTAANTPGSELEMRTLKLQREMAEIGMDGVLLLQISDLFYFSGTSQQAHLYIPVDGDPILMVKKSIPRARAESPLQTITSLDRPGQLPDILKAHNYPKPRILGMELPTQFAQRLPNSKSIPYERPPHSPEGNASGDYQLCTHPPRRQNRAN